MLSSSGMSTSCRNCGKILRGLTIGTSGHYCSQCYYDGIGGLSDIFDSKPSMTLSSNSLEEELSNPSSNPGSIFGDQAHHLLHDHDMLADNLNGGGGLLSGNNDCEMSDVWLSMEQAFENDLSAMLPITDDQLSNGGLIVSDFIDSNVSINELHSIKTEPLEFDDCDADVSGRFEIKVEVDDKQEFGHALGKTFNIPINTNAATNVAAAATRALLNAKDDQEKKIFSCQQCGKKYSALPDLKCHKMLCYGSNASDSSRPYKCEKCGCSYTRKYHLDTHKDRYHSNTSYSCGKCLKIYRAREDYLRHLRKNNCTASRAKVTSKTSQELIMNSQRLHNVHRFPCRHCPKRFFRRHYLERHIEEKHHKDWSEQESCDICTPRELSTASSPGTDLSVTPVESDLSSDDSGLMMEEMGSSIAKRIKPPPLQRATSYGTKEITTTATLINVIGHSRGDEMRGNGLYIKPDSSMYQCVMCNFTTKYIAQLSRHLEKHQATNTSAATTRKSTNFILSV